jgi:hypothetical protein
MRNHLTAESVDRGDLDVFVGSALAAAGFGGFFTALAGRVRELYAQAGTAQEPGAGPE